MARVAAETWALLLEYKIMPSFEHVPSKLNISGIYSRPDLSEWGDYLSQTQGWTEVVNHLTNHELIRNLRDRRQRTPEQVWAQLWTKLYIGARQV